tara:strand:+ start:8293 stop:10026 length:1734 start_codon:yes stop_codon:yes gene_type:complete
MKHFAITALVLLSIGCAQMSPLTGGYKDTIPPIIIQSLPLNNSVNSNTRNFFFAFDEPVDASKLRESLIISPYYTGNQEVKYKKNEVYVSFDSSFTENTTYIISFAGGIKDVTEGNELSNSKIVFSTGNYIDSSSVSGTVFSPIDNKRVENAVVGLYNEKDSFDLFTKKPTYFTFSDKSGLFKVDNVKPGLYKLYAFKDENKNFLAEYKGEAFGFIESPISVKNKNKNILVNLYTEDLSKLKLLRKRNRGNVYELVYSKKIIDVDIISNTELDYSLNDNKNILVYKNVNVKDSVFAIIKAYDESAGLTSDSLFISFGKDTGLKIEFTSLFNSNLKFELEDTIFYDLELSKPTNIENLNYKLLLDTIKIPDSVFYKVGYKDKNNFKGLFKINKNSVSDFVENHKKLYQEKESNDSLLNLLIGYYDKINTNTLTLSIEKGSIVSIENDTLKKISQKFTFKGSDFFGELNGYVSDSLERKNMKVELVTLDLKKKYKNKGSGSNILFQNIPPGKYYLRVIFDDNINNKWDYRSILSNNTSEEIIYFEKEIEIRSNWVIEDLVFDVNKSVDFLFEKLESEEK